MKELIEIQKELKAPKNQYNSFGKYSYRNAEDILEAVKPLLHTHGCILTISDEIIEVGERVYIESTATIVNSKNEEVSVRAQAREAEVQKGMNVAQITGSSSSYARKYALNGLFLIDDTKDPDTQQPEKDSELKTLSVKQSKAIIKAIADKNKTPMQVRNALKGYKDNTAKSVVEKYLNEI